MSNILLRNPYFVDINLSGSLSAKIEVIINGTLRYSIVKNKLGNNTNILFEVSELIRDFLDIKIAEDLTTVSDTHSVFGEIRTYRYSGLNATGTSVTLKSKYYIAVDGYAYFSDGANYTYPNTYAQSNNVIYRLADNSIRIPIYRNKATPTEVSFLFKGNLQKTETVNGSNTQSFKYVYNSINGVDTFKERVLLDGGVYEDSTCLSEFFDENELFDVDKIYISNSNGLEIIDVVTISECKYKPYKLSFVNKFGAIQDLWFFKKSIEKLNVSKENYNRFSVNQGNGTYSVLEHQNKTFNVQSTKKLTLNTGYVSEQYNEPMQELLQSEQVWLEFDGQIKPINIDTSSLTFKTSVNDKLVDYAIDISYSNNEINNIR